MENSVAMCFSLIYCSKRTMLLQPFRSFLQATLGHQDRFGWIVPTLLSWRLLYMSQQGNCLFCNSIKSTRSYAPLQRRLQDTRLLFCRQSKHTSIVQNYDEVYSSVWSTPFSSTPWQLSIFSVVPDGARNLNKYSGLFKGSSHILLWAFYTTPNNASNNWGETRSNSHNSWSRRYLMKHAIAVRYTLAVPGITNGDWMQCDRIEP